MCIIAIKSPGARFDWKILRECWDANPDGAGFAYPSKGGRITISKGFMEFNDFKRAVKAAPIGKGTEALLHFRIATHGAVSPTNCHPFPLSDDSETLSALEVVSDVAIAHNGIVSGMTPSDLLSDTMLFIRDYLAPMGAGRVTDTALHDIIGQAAASKLAIMSAAGISTIGKFEESDGWRYSNSSFLPSEVNQKTIKYGMAYTAAFAQYDGDDFGHMDMPTEDVGTWYDCDTCGADIDMATYDSTTLNWCDSCLGAASLRLSLRA
jgi:hypothetical protein